MPAVSRTETNNPSWRKQGNSFRNRPRKANLENTTNVLIVDSDPDTARIILEILAHKGIHANLVDNKEAALDFLDNNSCDLVLIGEKISPRDEPQCGFELLGKIKADLPEVPVIMMAEPGDLKAQNQSAAGGTNPGDTLLRSVTRTAIKAIRLGCCDFLIKPLNREK